jgi:hypothetical protein
MFSAAPDRRENSRVGYRLWFNSRTGTQNYLLQSETVCEKHAITGLDFQRRREQYIPNLVDRCMEERTLLGSSADFVAVGQIV